MSSTLADCTLANCYGIIREEFVGSTIDVLRLETSAGQANGSKYVTKVLRSSTDITGTKDRLITRSLIDIETGSPLLIPAGSQIDSVKVCKTSNFTLDDNLSFVLGYILASEEVLNADVKKALASRIAGINSKVTGRLLNKHKTLCFSQRLTSEALAAQEALYDKDSEEQEEEVENKVDYTCISGDSYVAESKDLYPVWTCLDGILNAKDLIFCVTYCPPAY